MRTHHIRKMLRFLPLVSVLLLAFIMFGCEGDKGRNGTSLGTLTGKVTDTAVPPHNVAGITVTPTPAGSTGTTQFGLPTASTDTQGNYTLTLPNGTYTLTYTKSGYATQTQNAAVISGQTTTLPTIALTQTAAAVVNVANVSFANGTTAQLTASTLVNDTTLGNTTAIVWKDVNGVTVGTGPTFTVHRPTAATFVSAVSELAKVRQSIYPPGHDPLADENDFDVPDFETLDRMQVLPISQQAFENAAGTTVKAFAQVGSSTFNTFSSAAIASVPTNTLPFVPNGGIRNVPVGQPVVLQGKVQGSYSWSFTAAPTGSTSVLADATTRFPHFIPDAPGTYTVTENATGTVRSINIYAGRYVGMLLPAPNDDPLGMVDTTCSQSGGSCHAGATSFSTPYQGGAMFFDTTAINTVFDIWTSSGHRHIMVKGMSTNPTHYTLSGCAKCHSVGFTQFSSSIGSNGFREVAKLENFTDDAWRANAPKFFKGFPNSLRLSEVQCESCHGPNGTGGAHGTGVTDAISARMSVSSDVCGTCHGEPLRHGRYQEWRGSGHGDFETAMGEGISGVSVANPTGTGVNTSCGGCHTGQGFPLLLAQLQGTNGNTANPNRTLTGANAAALAFLRTDNVQPQTCSTCHPVHNPGKEPGLVGDIVILRGDYQSGGAFDGTTPLLPSGFAANGVGKGALCITCHNSRNGGVGAVGNAVATLHEDADPNFGKLAAYNAPHEACQGDVLMGHNAYFFSSPDVTEDITLPTFTKVPQTGRRSAHSFLADTCVTCHLQKAPTDPTLGYPPEIAGAGTNHTFAIVTDRTRPAADQINALCSQCHGGFSGTGVQSSFDAAFKQLLISAGNAVLRLKFGSIANATAAGTTNLVFIPGRTPQVSIAGGVPINLATYLTTAPVAVGTANVSAAALATGFQRDLAKANWNICLVAPKYFATQFNSTSYDNGTPILNAAGGPVEVIGDQSKGVHNPSFIFNVMNVTQLRLNAM